MSSDIEEEKNCAAILRRESGKNFFWRKHLIVIKTLSGATNLFRDEAGEEPSGSSTAGLAQGGLSS